MNFIKFFNQNSISNKQESYRYVANTLINTYKNDGKKVFSFTSSSLSIDSCLKIIRNLGEHISKKGLDILLIQACLPENKVISKASNVKDKSLLKFDNLTSNELKEIVNENHKNYDLILIVIPSVIIKADALEYTKVCDKTILVEKYMYCYYSNYEETILYLKNSGIIPNGVITVV